MLKNGYSGRAHSCVICHMPTNNIQWSSFQLLSGVTVAWCHRLITVAATLGDHSSGDYGQLASVLCQPPLDGQTDGSRIELYLHKQSCCALPVYS